MRPNPLELFKWGFRSLVRFSPFSFYPFKVVVPEAKYFAPLHSVMELATDAFFLIHVALLLKIWARGERTRNPAGPMQSYQLKWASPRLESDGPPSLSGAF